MIKKKVKLFISILLFLIYLFPCIINSSGLQTDFAEVLIENLQIGRTYSLKEIANYPLILKNTSNKKIRIKIEPVIPKTRIKKGFEPIPSLSWISLPHTNFILSKGQSDGSDIILAIPDDTGYLGKKYQLDILSVGKQIGLRSVLEFELALKSRLLFTIANTQRKEKSHNKFNLNFNIDPLNIYVTNLAIGKEINLTDQNEIFEIKNNSENPCHYEISAIIPKTIDKKTHGYELCSETQLLKFNKDIVLLDPGESEKIQMSLHIPDEQKYKDKKLFFVIAVKVKEKNTSGTRYARLYIQIQK